MAKDTTKPEGGEGTLEKEAPKLVTVKANEPIREGGEFYDKGKEFQTSPERAKALGTTVEILG